MAYPTNSVQAVGLVPIPSCLLTLAKCEEDGEQECDCTRVSGVWHVWLEGGAYDDWIEQEWAIDQNTDCDVSITANSPTDYGPLGGSAPARWGVSKGDISTRWDQPVEKASRVNVSSLQAAVTRNTLSGTLNWVAGGGYGESCWPSGNLTLEVTGSRNLKAGAGCVSQVA